MFDALTHLPSFPCVLLDGGLDLISEVYVVLHQKQ